MMRNRQNFELKVSRFQYLLRLIAAFFYDLMLLCGLLLSITALCLFCANYLLDRTDIGTTWWFRTLLGVVTLLFYLWFWTHGGQTLGMKSWRLRVLNEQYKSLNWVEATRRLAAGSISLILLGFGFVWTYLDRENKTLHDRLAHTRLVVVPKSNT